MLGVAVRQLIPMLEPRTVSMQSRNGLRRIIAVFDHGRIQGRIRDVVSLCSLSDRHGFSADRDEPVRGGVVRLLVIGGPSTVVWTVVAIVIDAIERVRSRWPRPHVGIERCEIVAPTRADAYAATAVRVKAVILGVVAAPFHFVPRAVLRASGHAVSRLGSSNVLPTLAATAAALSCNQVALIDRSFCPAIASTQPHPVVPGLLRNRSDHCVVVEPLSNGN